MNIDFRIIIVQLVSFLIAVIVLWKIAWKPLLGMMNNRKKTIEEDFSKARESRENAFKLEQDYKNQLKRLDEHAQKIINDAVVEGKKQKEDIVKEAQSEAKKIIEEAKNEIMVERNNVKNELKAELVNMSIMIAEKILKDKIDKKYQDDKIKEFTEKIKNER